ncbi:MAG: hypothetical protein JWM98_638 [Thermoleophilia bacterium]|nr:hypothetical protein [Thermoleophilia bacterium]
MDVIGYHGMAGDAVYFASSGEVRALRAAGEDGRITDSEAAQLHLTGDQTDAARRAARAGLFFGERGVDVAEAVDILAFETERARDSAKSRNGSLALFGRLLLHGEGISHAEQERAAPAPTEPAPADPPIPHGR